MKKHKCITVKEILRGYNEISEGKVNCEKLQIKIDENQKIIKELQAEELKLRQAFSLLIELKFHKEQNGIK
jgi:hypothetical protein